MKYGEVNFGQTEALLNKIGGVAGMNKVLSGEWIVGEPSKVAKARASTKVLACLLELTGEPVKMSATLRFVARDKFVVDRQGELPISSLGDNFRNNFLDVVEENVPACTLKQRKLLKGSVDTPILNALGDKDPGHIEKARSALAHVFDYLKTANRTKGYIFYVEGLKGTVWAVGASWYAGRDGWDVEAYSVSFPGTWGAGHLVVSR